MHYNYYKDMNIFRRKIRSAQKALTNLHMHFVLFEILKYFNDKSTYINSRRL